MSRDDLNVLSAFMAVAEERSFTKAARRVGVSQSALSHAIRGLEEEIGVRLLARTTRSVAPTEAAEELLRSLQPALGDVRAALSKLAGMRGRPAGRVRLILSPLAASSVLGPGTRDSGSPRWRRARVRRRGSRRAAHRERRARPRSGAVVPAVSRLLHVLPEPAAADSRIVCRDRDAPPLVV